ncbi:MAG: ATP-binding protein [Fusobacteriota bacterium]
MKIKIFNKFKNQLMIILSTIILINIMIIYYFHSNFISSFLEDQLNEQLITKMEIIDKEIDLLKKDITRKSIIIERDNKLIEYINDPKKSYELKLIMAKYTETFHDTYIELYNKKGDIVFTSFPSPSSEKKPLVSKAIKQTYIYSNVIEKNSMLFVRNIITINNYGENLGVIFFYKELSDSYLDYIKNIIDLDLKLFNRNLKVVSSTIFDNQGERLKESSISKKKEQIIKKKNTINYFQYDNENNLGVEIIYSLDKIVEKEKNITQKLFILNLFLIILSLFILNSFSSKLLKPINLLIGGLKSVKNGNLNNIINYKSKNEMATAISTFNKMIRALKEKKKNEKRLANLDKIATAGRLASSIAHEIKNPLSGIALIIDTYLQNFNQIEFEKQDFEVISIEIKRINKIIERLMDFSKEEEINFITFDINSLLSEILTLLKRKAYEHENNIDLRGNSKKIYIKGDKNLLKQVFINIILNSIEATEEGSIIIDIIDSKDHIEIKISDTGKGMEPETIKKSMEPFYTTKVKGSGIGLAVVQKILNIHDFKYDIDSSVKKGTTFSIIVNKENNSNLTIKDMNYEYEVIKRKDR